MHDEDIDFQSLDVAALTPGDWDAIKRTAARRARDERARAVAAIFRRLSRRGRSAAAAGRAIPAIAGVGQAQ